MSELKKKLDSEAGASELNEESRKKLMRENEALQERINQLMEELDKINKAKKKFQSEVMFMMTM